MIGNIKFILSHQWIDNVYKDVNSRAFSINISLEESEFLTNHVIMISAFFSFLLVLLILLFGCLPTYILYRVHGLLISAICSKCYKR